MTDDSMMASILIQIHLTMLKLVLYLFMQLFSTFQGINKDFLGSWVNFLSSNPRPAQLMVSKDQPVLVTLEKTLSKHLNNEVKMVSIKADKRWVSQAAQYSHLVCSEMYGY